MAAKYKDIEVQYNMIELRIGMNNVRLSNISAQFFPEPEYCPYWSGYQKLVGVNRDWLECKNRQRQE